MERLQDICLDLSVKFRCYKIMDIEMLSIFTVTERKFCKIQRKILKVNILKFQDVKPIHKLFNGISLHSWGPNASFDTRIGMSSHEKCWMPNASFMSKKPKMPYLTHICHLTHVKYKYGNMGVKRCVRTSRMQTNAIKLLVNRFNVLKFQNTDFKIFLCIFWNFAKLRSNWNWALL